MPSAINPDIPMFGGASTQRARANFAAAKAEIELLQAAMPTSRMVFSATDHFPAVPRNNLMPDGYYDATGNPDLFALRGTVAIDTTVTHEGRNSYKLTPTDTDARLYFSSGTTTYNINAEGEKRYVVSFWMRRATPGESLVAVRLIDDNGDDYSNIQYITYTGDWVYVNADIELPNNTSTALLRIEPENAETNPVWFASVIVAPQTWIKCDGSELSRTKYAELFSRIGTTFGSGDGSTTFNLPDVQGRFLIGAGGDYEVGDTGGTEEETLTEAQIPEHDHGGLAEAGEHSHDVTSAGGHTHDYTTSTNGAHSHSASVGTAGSHTHDVDFPRNNSFGPGNQIMVGLTNVVDEQSFISSSNGNHSHSFTSSSAGSHSHSTTTSTTGDHTHDISPDGLHSHAVTVEGGGEPHNNIPPYLALNVFIRSV